MQKTIIPAKLKKGDMIRVIAPSISASKIKTSVKKRAEKNFQNMGFEVSYGKNSSKKDIISGSSIKDRITDIHAAFKDPKVKGIACITGGYNANTLLPYLDWELLKKNPKPLWGFSDITVLVNAMYAKTGMIAYIGPNVASFGGENKKGSVDYTMDYWQKCLTQTEPYKVLASEYWSERKGAARKNQGYVTIQKGKAEGVIIGGHLSTLNLLQGTEYMPSIKGAIVFIEEDDFGGDQMAGEFERNLESLLQLPDARYIKGLVIGRFQAKAKVTMEKLRYIIASKNLPQNIPVIANADFGHSNPKFTFPVGGTVRIEAKNGKAVIEIVKH